jgi:hypothetical protein
MRQLRALVVAIVLIPSIGDAQVVPSDFMVRLVRTRCFGTCPAYAVSIDAVGNVTYDGGEFVRVKGRGTARIPPSQVAELAAAVQRIGFFKLKNRYDAPVTDLPTTYVTVTSNGVTKRIEDYVGAPDALKEFEALIDRTAGTGRWIRIDVENLERLFRDGPRPTMPALREMMRDALGANDIDVVEGLLKRGVDAKESPDGVPWLIFARSVAAVRALIAAGANPNATTNGGETALHSAAQHPAAFAAALIESGARVDGSGEARATPLYTASCAGNAGVVKVLLAAGAKADASFEGVSALDCARGSQKLQDSFRQLWKPAYDEDYPAVIALLEAAVAKAKPRF